MNDEIKVFEFVTSECAGMLTQDATLSVLVLGACLGAVFIIVLGLSWLAIEDWIKLREHQRINGLGNAEIVDHEKRP